MKKGDIVKLIDNSSMAAEIDSLAVVIRGRQGKSPYFNIYWLSENSLGQCNGYYSPKTFIKVGSMKNSILKVIIRGLF